MFVLSALTLYVVGFYAVRAYKFFRLKKYQVLHIEQ